MSLLSFTTATRITATETNSISLRWCQSQCRIRIPRNKRSGLISDESLIGLFSKMKPFEITMVSAASRIFIKRWKKYETKTTNNNKKKTIINECLSLYLPSLIQKWSKNHSYHSPNSSKCFDSSCSHTGHWKLFFTSYLLRILIFVFHFH